MLVSAGGAPAQQPAAPAAAPIKLGIVSFLSGPAASPFGVPGRNGAEIVIEALNAGTAPAPYSTVGLGGTKIEAKYVDEAGSTAQVVTEFRNLVQRDQVDAVVGYISSGSCLAVTPVADELKALTVYFDCGTPRIFEEKPRKYVFRATPHATMDNTGAARYLLAKKKDITLYSGINQNYAWGQDSWRDFVGTMGVLAPKAKVDKELFPKLFAGEFGAEISTLLTVEIAGAAFQLLGRRSRGLHLFRARRAAPASACRSSAPPARSVDLAPARQDAGRHHHRRRAARTDRWRRESALNDWFQQDLCRALRHAADLSLLSDGAVDPRA